MKNRIIKLKNDLYPVRAIPVTRAEVFVMNSFWLVSLVVVTVFFSLTAHAVEPLSGGSFSALDARARAGEPITVVFFGASLTWGANATDQAHTSYRAVVADLLAQRYPKAPIHCHDAAIGGTGSQLGVFRLERDVLRRKPDLVFLDFSANDDINSADPETLASYESIVRRLVQAKIPVVQVAFPFKWNINAEQLPGMKRRLAHRAIAEAYGSGWGDAIELIVHQVTEKKATVDELWNTDPVHPGDAGYRLFAAAAWAAYEQAVSEQRIGKIPELMLNPSTYMTFNRVAFTSLGDLPAGWSRGRPHLTSIYYDFQMSRWQDEQIVATSMLEGKDAEGTVTKKSQTVAPLIVTVQATNILLFGEATTGSGHFRISVDGKVVTGRSEQEQEKGTDLFIGNRWKTGHGHQWIEIARGLDPNVAHVVEITPVFISGQAEELRFESVCVAGGMASVGRWVTE